MNLNYTCFCGKPIKVKHGSNGVFIPFTCDDCSKTPIKVQG